MNASDPLRQAFAAFSRGDTVAALRLGEAALRLRPADPGALQLIGIAHCQNGAVQKGLPFLRKALARSPKDVTGRFNLARALLAARELAEAEQVCTQGPMTPDLKRLHADILKAQGRLWEAAASYESIIGDSPQDFESWNNLGSVRLEEGDADGALAALDRARALNPNSSIVHINIARALTSSSRFDDALLFFQEAVRLAPRDIGTMLEFGETLSRMGRPREALVPLADAARLDQKDPRSFVAIGLALADIGDLAKAEQSQKMALRVSPAHAPAYLNLGIMLEKANRLDELRQLLDDAAKAGVMGAEIDHLRALLLRREGKLREALDLARAADTPALDPTVRWHLIGQLADQLGDTEAAFEAFEQMNQLAATSPAGRTHDRGSYLLEVEHLATVTTNDWFASWPPAPPPAPPAPPVFLVGFPRSGTTLLDTILMGHRKAHVLEELPILAEVAAAGGEFARIPELGAAELTRLRALYFEKLAQSAPAAPGQLVVDKNPLSMLRAPLIHRLFPDAKIILALRHPCDVVLSCFMQNFKVTQAMASFLDLTSGSLLYDRVFAYWEQCREILPLNVHTIRYEAMVADPEGEIRPLLDFIGLDWDPAMLDHQRTAQERGYIRTPSYAQVTERIYERASGRWARYRSHMEPVLPILEPWVERLGYALD